jgi:proteasome assembly chaperone (PAC2) family protein
MDPAEIYEVDEDVAAELAELAAAGTGPVLVHAVRGFVDAGHAGEIAADHLVDELRSRRLVTFDVDQLLDYRSRRPMMTFDASSWREYEDPELVVDLVDDADGTPFLLLHGTEPDVQWERYVAAMRQLVERFSVPLTVGIHGVPMGVPHTRPITLTAHATRPDLVADFPAWFGMVRVPASAQTLLELRLGQSGHDAMGFVVHVPHYLAQSTYPQAAIAALHRLERVAGLDLKVGELEGAAQEAARQIEEQVSGSPEVASLVQALEEQYDAFTRGIGRAGLLGATDLPTADELGAEFERFLAEQAPDEG